MILMHSPFAFDGTRVNVLAMLSVTAAFYREETEHIMKKIATFAIALGLSAGAAVAGGYVAPVVDVEPVVVDAAAGSSAAGWVVPALLLIGVAAAIASDDSSSSSGTN